MNSTTGIFTAGRPELKLVISWMLLCSAVVLHVIDEATHNFLAVYNPTVMALRERVPWLSLPVFSFRMWIAGLAITIALGFSLSLFLLRGSPWVRPIVGVLFVLMIANGLNHTVGTILGRTVASVHFPRPMPGFYSSPTLIAASIYGTDPIAEYQTAKSPDLRLNPRADAHRWPQFGKPHLTDVSSATLT